MSRTALLTLAIIVLAGCTGGSPTQKFNASDAPPPGAAPTAERWAFDSDAAGESPRGASVFSGTWEVAWDASAPSAPNVLCQRATATFPAISLGSKVYADLVMSAKAKPISGSEDQAIGLIFRIQDAKNYYILRANALEDNLILFKYAGGVRIDIKGGNAHVASNAWHDLRVEARGAEIKGFVEGALVVTATDTTYAAGQVGLWTKADSVSCFDDVHVTST